jgi:hypothetical protein
MVFGCFVLIILYLSEEDKVPVLSKKRSFLDRTFTQFFILKVGIVGGSENATSVRLSQAR